MSEYKSKIAIHPGRTLRNYLAYLGVSQKWLADRTGITEKHISGILNENASITAETAIKLSNTLGGSIDFWIKLDSNYRASVARISQERAAAMEVGMLDEIPYVDMAKIGWVSKTNNKTDRVMNLYSFFGISSLKHIRVSQPAAFRKFDGRKVSEFALAAWLRRGEIIANSIKDVVNYDEKILKKSLIDIKEIAYNSPRDFLKRISTILARCGVVLVVAEYIPKTYVNGATRWIGHHPVIELSDRGKRDDIFWFTLFHEIGHILKHSKKDQFIDFEQAKLNSLEEEADNFASEILLSDNVYTAFLREHSTITKNDILYLANNEHISPSIVLGRLKRDNIVPYTSFNDLHKKLEVSS